MVIRLNIDDPLWDLNTFAGRVLHYAWMTDPRTCLRSDEELYAAKQLVKQFREENEPPETTYHDVIAAKQMYESAFHPDTDELQNVFGRMSFQVPGGLIVTTGMLSFYKTTKAMVFWQWLNQSFNAGVNFTNRNANAPISQTELATAYCSATFSAVATALGLKQLLANSPQLMQRFVPFAAVAAANFVNIPLMRQTEIRDGVELVDANGRIVVKSKYAAAKGITQVAISRTTIAAPGMIILPMIMNNLERGRVLRKIPYLNMPIQLVLLGFSLSIMVPIGCAIYPQQCAIGPDELKSWEMDNYNKLVAAYGADHLPEHLYFNKGL